MNNNNATILFILPPRETKPNTTTDANASRAATISTCAQPLAPLNFYFSIENVAGGLSASLMHNTKMSHLIGSQ
jgi:hypothetical protein